MEKKYQTIIIGAGPAGLIAGRYLDDALILDKKKEIGKPVQCGEGISRWALERQGIEPDKSWISCEIHKVERIMPNGKAIGRFHKEAIGYVLDRTAFEKFLAKECKAEIQLDSKVVDLGYENSLWGVKTENEQIFKAKYLIGADGAHSIVREKVFPENQGRIEFIPAVEYLLEVEKEFDTKTIKIYFDNEKYKDGYVWVFPKSKKTANIGLGDKGNLSELFEDFLNNKIKNYYGGYQSLENRSGTVSIQHKDFKFFKLNTLLLGDAAGLVDPIFKGGINQAMYSGKIAAECLLGNRAELYEKKMKSMPFANPKLIKAGNIFYSFNNRTLNKLGEVMENRSTVYFKTLPGVMKILSKSCLRKNIFKIFRFFSIWQKNEDYLW